MPFDFDTQSIYGLLTLADDLTKTVKGIHDKITEFTGKPVDEIRAERDALSKDTHAIINEERAKTPMP